MSEASIVAIVVAIISLLGGGGGGLVAWLKHKTEQETIKQKNYVDSSLAALQAVIDKQGERLASQDKRLDEQELEIQELVQARRDDAKALAAAADLLIAEQRYTHLLEDHINARKPPPPPPRPHTT